VQITNNITLLISSFHFDEHKRFKLFILLFWQTTQILSVYIGHQLWRLQYLYYNK